MTRLAFALALGGMLSAGAVDFSPAAADGDLATPGNWTGGALPGENDAATVDGSTASLDDFRLSADLSVGALGFANWTRRASVNLGGFTLSAASAQFGGAGPVLFTNGTLQTSGKVAVLASSTFAVGEGATVRMPASVAKNEELKLSKAGAKMVVDGGTFIAPAATAGDCGNLVGDWGGVAAALEVRNGGRFEIQSGRSQFTMMNASRLLVDGGSTFLQQSGNVSYPFIIGYSGGVVAVTNSTFQFYQIRLGGSNMLNLGAKNARLTFHNSSLTSSYVDEAYNYGIETFGDAKGNRVSLSGSSTTANMSIRFAAGESNVVSMAGVSHVGRVALTGGRDNAVEMSGGSGSGRIDLRGGVRNRFSSSGTSRPVVPEIAIGGTSNSVDVSGSTFAQKDKDCMLRFASGHDALFAVRNGCVAFVGQWGDNPAVAFSGATNATILVDDATLKPMGYLDWSAVPSASPGVRLEFSGAAPQFVCTFWQNVRQVQMTIGAANAADKNDVPRLRFRLPEEPYAKPVITTSDSWFRVAVNPAAVLEFDLSGCGKALSRRTYPLIDRIPSMSDATLAALNETAGLPKGCKLVATKNVTSNNANGTYLLSLVKSGDGGFAVFVK